MFLNTSVVCQFCCVQNGHNYLEYLLLICIYNLFKRTLFSFFFFVLRKMVIYAMIFFIVYLLQLRLLVIFNSLSLVIYLVQLSVTLSMFLPLIFKALFWCTLIFTTMAFKTLTQCNLNLKVLLKLSFCNRTDQQDTERRCISSVEQTYLRSIFDPPTRILPGYHFK